METAIELLKLEVEAVRKIAVRLRKELLFKRAAHRLHEVERLQEIVDLLEKL